MINEKKVLKKQIKRYKREIIGEEIIEAAAPYTSISLEKDLQNYLAENTGVIKGKT